MRWIEMQLCPANENAFAAILSAVEEGASPQTITGVEFPSSSATCFFGARSLSFQPTSPDPVNVSTATRSSPISTSPISEDDPATTLSQPAGSPASSSSSASRRADSGVADAGLSTTGQPAATDGASLGATRL